MFKNLITLIVTLAFFLDSTGLGYLPPAAPAAKNTLRPVATRIASNTLPAKPKWIEGVRKVRTVPEGDKQIRLIGNNLGRLTVIKEAEYNGKRYMVKFMKKAEREKKVIIPEAEILHYLNQLNIPGIPKAAHFLEIQLSKHKKRKAILFEKFPPGETLLNRLDIVKKIPEEEAVDIILKVSDIVKRLHGAGVCHWDISLKHIWITDEGEVILFDFDFAFRGKEEFLQRELYAALSYLYASQNRYLWRKNIEYPKDDIFPPLADEVYSLAMVLFDMIIGPIPVVELIPMDYANGILTILDDRPEISTGLKGILYKALSDGRCDYQSVNEFIQALKDYRGQGKTKPTSEILPKTESQARDAVESLRGLLKARSSRNLETPDLIRLWELVRVLEGFPELSSPQSLSKNGLSKVRNSLNELLSPSLREIIPGEMAQEAEQLKTEAEELLQDLVQAKTVQTLPAATQDLRQRKVSFTEKIREIGIIGASLAILFIGAGYIYLRGYYEAGRKFSIALCTALTSFITAFLADFLRQRIQVFRGWLSKSEIDGKHILRYAMVCSIAHGLGIGYLWHDLSFNASKLQQIFKIAVDLAILNPLYFTLYVLTLGRWLVEKRPLKSAVEDAVNEWLHTYKLVLLFWPWALPLSYFLLSTTAPILSIAVFNLAWVTILSFIISKHEQPAPETFDRNFRIYERGSYIWLMALTVAMLINVIFFYPWWRFAIVYGMAAASFLFFSCQLQEIKSEKEAAAEEKASEDENRLEDIKIRLQSLQTRLIGHFLKELQPPSAEETAAELQPESLEHLQRFDAAG